MKLLIYSHFFAPSVRDVETITMSLASGLSQLRTPEDRQETNFGHRTSCLDSKQQLRTVEYAEFSLP